MALRHAGPGGDSSPPSAGPSSPTAAVGSPGHGRAHPTPIEGLIGRTSASFRRRMVLGTAVGVVVLAGVAVLFAWRQYDRAKSSALSDLQARVASVGGVVDVSFTGDIALLRTAAQSPVVVSGDLVGMHRYFGAVETSSGSVFSGGLAWVDREGDVEVRGTAVKSSPINVGGRDYFRQVLLTGEPYVSPGLVGKLTRKPLVAIAVPTFDASGRESGVLVGSILLGPTRESPEALSLGFGGLDLIDRDGRLLLSNLAPVANRALVAQMSRIGSGVIAGTPGLNGRGSDVVAFALSPVSGWMVVIDQSESSVFASARRALVLDLTSVGGGGLLLLAILTLVALRTRREAEVQDARARAWGALTRTLAAASTPPEVAAALLDALHDALPDSLSVVGFERDDGLEVTAASPPTYGRRLVEDQPMLDEIARRGLEGRRSQPLDQTPELRLAYTLSGRRLRTLHTLPVVGDGGRPLGSISVLSAQARLASGEWALLESFADQAAVALGRARVFEREHELAVRLQRNLLPDRLPSAEGVELAGHYHAGAAAVEVGGDWYDAARRPDGILELCVGDVSGRGIGAATIMGRQRNIFHAYAFESPSPAEIIRRMLRHVDTDDMITVACVALDLYTGELAYACAGHPPPLLLDQATGQTRRLDQASAPPIGVAEPSDIVEAQIRIDGAATLALYTDGLVERRGASIDDGIDLLARVLGSVPDPTPDVVLEQVSAGIGEPVDDVALLIVRLDARQAPFELEVPADPAGLPAIRRRLRGWLERELVGSEEAAEVVLAVSEACNNAIEHAYPGGGGTLGVWVTREAERLRVVVEDRGSWREERPSDDRGRGLSLMRQLMDTVEIETGPRGTRITLERRLAAATGATGLARTGAPR